MINSARAETDARSARSADGAVTGGNVSDFGDKSRQKKISDSDGEGSGYEDELDLRRRGALQLKKSESM